MTNTSNLISQLEPSAQKEILLESKMPTEVSPFFGTGVRVTPEIWVPGKDKYEITSNIFFKNESNYKSRYYHICQLKGYSSYTTFSKISYFI